MSEESKVTKLLTKTGRQKKAEADHRKKAEAYRQKRITDMQSKLALGTMQLIHGMKQAPWCTRFELCWEIFFKRTNKDYNDMGEWVGKPEHYSRPPWCVRIKNMFSKKVKKFVGVRNKSVDLKDK